MLSKIISSIYLHCDCRFGICEPYEGLDRYCNQVFREGKDNIFLSSMLGTQQDISLLLNEYIPNTLTSTAQLDPQFCYEYVIEIICKYYMSPCGNESVKSLPQSICPEDCLDVQKYCPTTWEAASHSLQRQQFIKCNQSTANIFPLPSCCNSTTRRQEIPKQSKLT